jgi:hypothetical protein
MTQPKFRSYSFQRVNVHGALENVYCSFDSLSFNWRQQFSSFYITFFNHESEFEASRDTLPRKPQVLKIEGIPFLQELPVFLFCLIFLIAFGIWR